jgi:uncharacterized protein (TIGR04255 family)
MPEYEVFPNAPVEEAIITIRVPRIDDLSEGVERLTRALEDRYPVVEASGPTDEGDPEDPSNPGGTAYRFLSADRQQAVQVTVTTFSFHRLRPYTRWEHFVTDARQAWEFFVGTFSPVSVQDVQLRFVNQFELPVPAADWADYLLIHPNLPSAVDTGLTSYFMSLNLADRSVPATAIVTQTTTLAGHDQAIDVTYDIDTRSRFVPDSAKKDQLWEILERLREYKNRLFFEGLTERTKELFR